MCEKQKDISDIYTINNCCNLPGLRFRESEHLYGGCSHSNKFSPKLPSKMISWSYSSERQTQLNWFKRSCWMLLNLSELFTFKINTKYFSFNVTSFRSQNVKMKRWCNQWRFFFCFFFRIKQGQQPRLCHHQVILLCQDFWRSFSCDFPQT